MIFLSVWSFTTSLTVTMACITSIGYSLGLAYFTYTFILRLSFFPFMNILAVVIALGVGADDTFILSRFVPELQRKSSKILEECSVKKFIRGWETVSIIYYSRPKTCINHPLQAWIQYQAAHPKLICYTTPCKLACHLP